MKLLRWPVSRRDWDRVFLLALPVLAAATAIGAFFGGPLDNAIVLVWLAPLWRLARSTASSAPGAPCHVGQE